MTDIKNKKAGMPAGNDGSRALGNQADPSVKASRPQVSDANKIGMAASAISDLDERLARLNDASGPFGAKDVDFKSNRVDALLDDEPEDEVEAEAEVEVVTTPGVADPVEDFASEEDVSHIDGAMSLDDILGNDIEEADAEEDAISVTPISKIEVLADGDKEYNDTVDEFLLEMGEEGIFAHDEDPSDPIDDIVDAALEANTAKGKSLFSDLFNEPDKDDEIFDAGVSEDLDEAEVTDEDEVSPPNFEDDEDLFYDSIEFEAADPKEEVSNRASIAGEAFFEDEIDMDGSIDEDDTSDSSAGLPTLTMGGGDDDFYAPGTDYEDDDLTHTSEEEINDGIDIDAAPEQFKRDIEEDDNMGISEKGSEGADQFPEDLEDLENVSATVSDDASFANEGLDDLLGDDDEDEFSETDEYQEEADADGESNVDELFGDDAGSEYDEDEDDAADEVPTDLSEDEGDVVELPAKKSRVKALLLSAACIAVLAGGAGIAVFTGVIGGSQGAPVVTAEPVDMNPEPSVIALDPGPMEPVENFLSDPEPEAEAGTIRLSDLISTSEERGEDQIIDSDIKSMMDPAIEDVASVDPLVIDTPVVALDTEALDLEVEDITDGVVTFEPVGIDIPSPVSISSIDDTIEDASAVLDAVEDDITAIVDPVSDIDPILSEDPIIALAEQIRQSGEERMSGDDEVDLESEEASSSLFVEEGRVVKIEDDVTTIGLRIDDLTSEVSKMNGLIMQSMERNSLISSRVESNERSLLGVSSILAEFSKVRESLDQTQIVLLDIAARVGGLEANNPADRDEVAEALKEINGEMVRLTANMAILARMTVNGASTMKAPGASATASGVQTSQSEMPRAGNDTVYDSGSAVTSGTTPPAQNVPSDSKKGDFVEGYGYVLDVVPASGNQNLVVMENGSVLVPK